MASIENLVGKPFEYGGRGPDKYDCYGLIKELLEKRQGIKIPDYTSPKDSGRISALFSLELRLWEPAPREMGAIALFRLGRSTHCGYLLTSNEMIHCIQKIGVCIERLNRWESRLVDTYRYVG